MNDMRERVIKVLKGEGMFSQEERNAICLKIAEDRVDGMTLGNDLDVDDQVDSYVRELRAESSEELAKEYDQRFGVSPDAQIRELKHLLNNVKGTEHESLVQHAIDERKKELGVSLDTDLYKGLESERPVKKECECGAAKHKFSSHSDWCPIK